MQDSICPTRNIQRRVDVSEYSFPSFDAQAPLRSGPDVLSELCGLHFRARRGECPKFVMFLCLLSVFHPESRSRGPNHARRENIYLWVNH